MAASATILSIATYAGLVYTIPPPQCFANFNWNDCGKSPKPVIYYRKTGSRCEVGIWRGCLPNINMFKDEYECVSTCIFTVRAAEQDWHQINSMEEDITGNMTDNDNGTDFGNSTSEYDNSTSINSSSPAANESVIDGGNATDATTGDDVAGDATTGDDVAGDDTTGNGTTVEGAADGEETAAEMESEVESDVEPVSEPDTEPQADE